MTIDDGPGWEMVQLEQEQRQQEEEEIELFLMTFHYQFDGLHQGIPIVPDYEDNYHVFR